MEMSIKEIIERIESVKECDEISLQGYANGHESLEKDIEAFGAAVDIINRYQKIAQIAEECSIKILPKELMSTFTKDVLEVLENGRTDV